MTRTLVVETAGITVDPHVDAARAEHRLVERVDDYPLGLESALMSRSLSSTPPGDAAARRRHPYSVRSLVPPIQD